MDLTTHGHNMNRCIDTVPQLPKLAQPTLDLTTIALCREVDRSFGNREQGHRRGVPGAAAAAVAVPPDIVARPRRRLDGVHGVRILRRCLRGAR